MAPLAGTSTRYLGANGSARALNEANQLLDHLGTPEGTNFTVLRAVGLVHLIRWSLLHEQALDEAVVSNHCCG